MGSALEYSSASSAYKQTPGLEPLPLRTGPRATEACCYGNTEAVGGWRSEQSFTFKLKRIRRIFQNQDRMWPTGLIGYTFRTRDIQDRSQRGYISTSAWRGGRGEGGGDYRLKAPYLPTPRLLLTRSAPLHPLTPVVGSGTCEQVLGTRRRGSR